jgi:hypothetical protein
MQLFIHQVAGLGVFEEAGIRLRRAKGVMLSENFELFWIFFWI